MHVDDISIKFKSEIKAGSILTSLPPSRYLCRTQRFPPQGRKALRATQVAAARETRIKGAYMSDSIVLSGFFL